MRQRSNLIIVFGIAFFLIGAVIVFLVLNDEDDDGSTTRARPAEVTVFVAAQDIPANTPGSDVIEQGMLTSDTVSAGSEPAGAITSVSNLDNRIFATEVKEGDVITSAQLTVRSLSNIRVPEGFDGVAVSIPSTNGGAGYVAPGDTVNVYGLFGTGDQAAGLTTEGPVPRTELVLTNVLVLDVSAQQGTSVSSANQDDATIGRQQPSGSLTYFLALRPTDAERLVQVSQFAELYLGLTAEDAPPTGDTPGSDGRSVLGPVSADSAPPQG